MAQPEHLNFRASGIDFAALSWGPARGPLALCLHGYPDTAWTWRHLGPRLAADGWRVVAPFMRGYAPSGLAPDGSYQPGALVRDAVQAHAALGGDRRAVLIGHDWGAVAAYGVAGFAPDLFARIVTLGYAPLGVVLAPPRGPADLMRLQDLPPMWYVALQQLPVEPALDRLIPLLWSRWSPAYEAREDVERALAALDEPRRRTAALCYYRGALQPWFRSSSYRAEQRSVVAIPKRELLYLHGREDGCLPARVAKRSAQVLRGEVRIVEHAGHWPHLERPDQVGDLIAAHLG